MELTKNIIADSTLRETNSLKQNLNNLSIIEIMRQPSLSNQFILIRNLISLFWLHHFVSHWILCNIKLYHKKRQQI